MSTMSYASIWNETLQKIQESNYFDTHTFNSWISKTTLFKIEDNIAYVAYRSTITFSILKKQKEKELFESTLSEVWGDTLTIQYIHQREMEKMMPEEVIKQRTNVLLENKFNPSYTFENFVEGNSNAEAYAACLACCTQTTSHLFNPLMLYGNSGLGKTHLLHAMGNYLAKEHPECKVIYMYSGDLVSLLIEAMKTKNVHGNTVERVKEQLLDCDYFLIDDIQNLQQHSSSQEIFFTVYNQLIQKNTQIIITSDMHPSEISGLQSRLISRFVSGLTISISKPEFETSKAILKKKIEGREEGVNMSEDVIDYLAGKYSNDVRNLEGTLNRLIFNATLFNPDVIDMDFARKVLIKEPIVSQSDELTIKKIKKAVTRFYGLSYKDLEGKCRQKFIANARHICVYLSRDLLHKSYVSIGQELGGRDHTTISSSYERAKKLIQKDEAFKTAVEKIRSTLDS